MVKSKIWRILAMLLAFSLVAAACGSGDDEVATDGDTTTSEPEATDDSVEPTDDGEATTTAR